MARKIKEANIILLWVGAILSGWGALTLSTLVVPQYQKFIEIVSGGAAIEGLGLKVAILLGFWGAVTYVFVVWFHAFHKALVSRVSDGRE